MNEAPNTHTAEFSDAMVSTYETWAGPLSARLARVALGRTTVSAGDRVLDIGAGMGALALQAAALGARVTAVDLSSAMVARLTRTVSLRTRTDADGRFTFHRVEAAKFILSVQLSSSEMMYYPGALDVSKTEILEVHDGQPLSGLSIRVPRSGQRRTEHR